MPAPPSLRECDPRNQAWCQSQNGLPEVSFGGRRYRLRAVLCLEDPFVGATSSRAQYQHRTGPVEDCFGLASGGLGPEKLARSGMQYPAAGSGDSCPPPYKSRWGIEPVLPRFSLTTMAGRLRGSDSVDAAIPDYSHNTLEQTLLFLTLYGHGIFLSWSRPRLLRIIIPT